MAVFTFHTFEELGRILSQPLLFIPSKPRKSLCDSSKPRKSLCDYSKPHCSLRSPLVEIVAYKCAKIVVRSVDHADLATWVLKFINSKAPVTEVRVARCGIIWYTVDANKSRARKHRFRIYEHCKDPLSYKMPVLFYDKERNNDVRWYTSDELYERVESITFNIMDRVSEIGHTSKLYSVCELLLCDLCKMLVYGDVCKQGTMIFHKACFRIYSPGRKIIYINERDKVCGDGHYYEPFTPDFIPISCMIDIVTFKSSARLVYYMR